MKMTSKQPVELFRIEKVFNHGKRQYYEHTEKSFSELLKHILSQLDESDFKNNLVEIESYVKKIYNETKN